MKTIEARSVSMMEFFTELSRYNSLEDRPVSGDYGGRYCSVYYEVKRGIGKQRVGMIDISEGVSYYLY